jgi:hypothetical protein
MPCQGVQPLDKTVRYHNYAKHRALKCEDAIIPQSSRRPLSYLKTNPNFASSTSLEVANEGWNLQCSYSLRASANQLGTNDPQHGLS